MMQRRQTLLALAGAAALPTLAQTPTAVAADLAGDIDLLREALLALHPGLYRYNDASAIDAALAGVRTS